MTNVTRRGRGHAGRARSGGAGGVTRARCGPAGPRRSRGAGAAARQRGRAHARGRRPPGSPDEIRQAEGAREPAGGLGADREHDPPAAGGAGASVADSVRQVDTIRQPCLQRVRLAVCDRPLGICRERPRHTFRLGPEPPYRLPIGDFPTACRSRPRVTTPASTSTARTLAALRPPPASSTAEPTHTRCSGARRQERSKSRPPPCARASPYAGACAPPFPTAGTPRSDPASACPRPGGDPGRPPSSRCPGPASSRAPCARNRCTPARP